PAGEPPAQGDRLTMFGELLDGAGIHKVGEFYAACFCTGSPFGASPVAAANVEMHTLNLTDGSIVAMGSATAGDNVYALVGGTGAGKVSMQDFHFTMRSSKASPKLLLACASGQHIKEAVLIGLRGGERPQRFLKYRLTDVLVSSYQIAGDPPSEDRPGDQLS